MKNGIHKTGIFRGCLRIKGMARNKNLLKRRIMNMLPRTRRHSDNWRPEIAVSVCALEGSQALPLSTVYHDLPPRMRFMQAGLEEHHAQVLGQRLPLSALHTPLRLAASSGRGWQDFAGYVTVRSARCSYSHRTDARVIPHTPRLPQAGLVWKSLQLFAGRREV